MTRGKTTRPFRYDLNQIPHNYTVQVRNRFKELDLIDRVPGEINQRGHKQMDKYTVFMDWKNQHSENEYTTQSNLQVQCNPYQATNGIFHRTRTNNFKICMEVQKNLEQPKQS